MLFETLQDLVLLVSVGHEMVNNHIVFNQSLDVELSLEDGQDQSDLIGCHKPLKLDPSGIFEGQSLVLVLQADSDLLTFSFFVQAVVVEVDQNESFVLRVLNALEYLGLKFETFSELVIENFDTFGVHNENIVRVVGSLRSGVKLVKQLLCLIHENGIVSSFLGGLSLVIAMVKLTKPTPDEQVHSVWLLGPECKMEGIVTN